MPKTSKLLILLFFVWADYGCLGQEKPKVALVLSGGGAKGLAHIPLLQTLDSMGIVPDLVVGSSMGSIVGGLYALGYSGDSLAQIAQSADWERILGNQTSFKEVAANEKSEFGKYPLTFDIKQSKLKAPQSFIRDQNLYEFLSLLAFPAMEIGDFDELPIPFRAVAVDIVNGKEVIIDEGSLYHAMRSSMAIPSIFKPVEHDSTLLVDGGVLNNFPTDVAKSLGADFIIGSDVGGGMSDKEALENMTTLLFQTGMLNSNLKNQDNRDLCDILLNHVPNLTYGTGDFLKADSIYHQGKTAVDTNLNELSLLAQMLKDYPQRTPKLPEFKQYVTLDTIFFQGISEENLPLVESQLDLQSTVRYGISDFNNALNRLIGTTLFDHVYLKYQEDTLKAVVVGAREKAPGSLKLSLHYDNERGVGLIANATVRNILGKYSRSHITIDVAENPQLRLQHQKQFGKTHRWWWRSTFYGERLKQSLFLQGQRVSDFRNTYFKFANQIYHNFNSQRSYLGGGVTYYYNGAKPRVDPDVMNNPIDLNRYKFQNLELDFTYYRNSHNKVFFADAGSSLFVNLSQSLYNKVNVERVVDQNENIKASLTDFTKFQIELDQRFSIVNRLSGVVQVSGGFTFFNNSITGSFSYTDFGYGAFYYLGGVQTRPRMQNKILPGLREFELAVTQYMLLNLGIQWSPWRSFYAIPHVSLASVGRQSFNDYFEKAFSPTGSWMENIETSAVISGGITFGYQSILGPVFFDVSRVNEISKFRFFLGLGFQFNRSYK